MKQAVVVVALALTVGASGVRAQMLDHLKCHKMKDPQRLKATVDFDALQAQFSAQGCTIGKPKFYCVPGTKRNVQPPEAVVFTVDGQQLENPFICYNAKCPETLPTSNGVTDQFGSRTETGYKSSLICTPAIVGTVTTTSTTPGQTTTTVPGGGACSAAGAPECNGTCTTPGNICVSTGSACGCVANPNHTPCGGVQGPMACSGDCPASTPWCKTVGTACSCSATP